MYNPLKDPIPADPVQRVHALARDLAYGVVMNLWGAELETRGNTERDRFPDGAVFDELRAKWGYDATALNKLIAFGYAAFHYEGPLSRQYILTPKAFDLLSQPAPTSVFISYRRGESSAFALLVLARFKALGLEPFLDMDIAPGDEWHDRLHREVTTREHCVCLIGPTTLESEFVRAEILWALESGAQILPIWHNGFDDALLAEFQARFPELGEFYEKQAIRVEQENVVAYEGALIQLLNRFGVTPS